MRILEEISDSVGKTSNIHEAVLKLINENIEFREKFEKLETEGAKAIKEEMLQKIETIEGVRVITAIVDVSSMDMLKNLAGKIRESGESLVFAAGASIKGKANILVSVSKDLIENEGLNASEIIREAAIEIEGGGGGQPFLATAGGKNPEGLQAALDKIKNLVRNR